MKNHDNITVASGGTTIHATAYKLKDGWWWVGTDKERPSGPLGDEGIHYVRGYLRTWWPPHRKRADALIVAAALGDTPTVQVPELRMTLKGLDADIVKLTRDARNMMKDAERLATSKSVSFSARTRYTRRL